MSSASQAPPPPAAAAPSGSKDDKPKKGDADQDTIKEFFLELEGVKEKIAIVKNSTQEIKTLHDRALNNVISEQENSRTPFMANIA